MENAQKKGTRKTDRRTLYTRKVIMDSYIRLLKEKPHEKIKVTELCQLADINRCTFYLHFLDVTDVRSAIEQEIIDKFKKHIETQMHKAKNRKSLSDSFNEKMLNDDAYVTLLGVTGMKSPLFEFMHDFYRLDMESSLPHDSRLTERQRELLYDFIVGGVTAIQVNWLQNGIHHIQEENRFIDHLVHMLINVKNFNHTDNTDIANAREKNGA